MVWLPLASFRRCPSSHTRSWAWRVSAAACFRTSSYEPTSTHLGAAQNSAQSSRRFRAGAAGWRATCLSR